jgi:hypothetical protein
MTIERSRPHNTSCICAGCEALRHSKSARSVNLYGLVDGQPGPVESRWIGNRWRQLGGCSSEHQGGHVEYHITEAALFAAVRNGRINL